MIFDEALSHYYALTPLGGGYTKPGVRGYPGLPAGLELLLARADFTAGHLVDATGSAGVLARAARGQADRVSVLETSQAALTCSRAAFKGPDVTLAAGVTWDIAPESADVICLLPPTDRGNARLEADFVGAARALVSGGRAYMVMHKDGGAKRYEKRAGQRFGRLEILAKVGGWRLSRATKTLETPPLPERVKFEAAGLKLEAEPGVYAAGKLDPGTAALLEVFDVGSVAGRGVLDLGCGYGVLALKAALSGAAVTALDDDLLAVRSTYRNARTYGLDVRCLHSDITSELRRGDTFDLVITNPPFHLGTQVRLEVPHAFIAAAYRHLVPGGELVLVANKALDYERLLAHFAYWETVAALGAFKVLRAVR